MLNPAANGTLSGFSLDEAARIALEVAAHPNQPVRCPRCGAWMHVTAGGDGGRRIWILRCDATGRGLVFQQQLPGARWHRTPARGLPR